MKMTSKTSGLSPLIRAVLTMHLDHFVRTFDSLNPACRRQSIAALRTAVTDSYVDAFQHAVKAGAEPKVVMRGLGGEVQEFDRRLQDIAPHVELTRCVEANLRRRMPTVEVTARRGRPVETAAAIDGNWLRERRGDMTQTVFARMCGGISVDTLQRAERGDASHQTIRKINRYLKRSPGGQTIEVEKPEKKAPQETART